jgi:uncharacterized protein (TIGR02757 family)
MVHGPHREFVRRKRFGSGGEVCIFQTETEGAVNYKQKQYLGRIYRKYHRPCFLRLDPLDFVRGLDGRENREIGGLVCSALAYGRVEQIRKSIARVLEITGRDLKTFCRDVPFQEKRRAFDGFFHRFNTGTDVALLFECALQAINRHGSIEGAFLKGFDKSDKTVKRALDAFSRAMRASALEICPSVQGRFAFFFPAPGDGTRSACKRLNMYLRWMVRGNDGIDLGIWKNVPPSALVMPVDTHVAAAAARLGLTRRASAGWAMAEEITDALRSLDPHDPVRFDFSLCRAGMVGFRAKKSVKAV